MPASESETPSPSAPDKLNKATRCRANRNYDSKDLTKRRERQRESMRQLRERRKALPAIAQETFREHARKSEQKYRQRNRGLLSIKSDERRSKKYIQEHGYEAFKCEYKRRRGRIYDRAAWQVGGKISRLRKFDPAVMAGYYPDVEIPAHEISNEISKEFGESDSDEEY